MSTNSHKPSKDRTLNLFANATQASIYVAQQIATLITQQQKQDKLAVLGLATGNTPKRVYQELVRLHQNEGLSFVNVVSFNLDEYYPIYPEDEQSYTYFMQEHLFKHVNIKPQHIHIPHTRCETEDILDYCKDFENKIASYGGLDLQLLGIGRNGHIGFNEPGSSFDSSTRLVNLHAVTREDAQADFGGLDQVPQQAVSMGVNTIRQAKRILLLALGERKSAIICKALQGEITPEIPASFLQSLAQVEYVLDHEAAGEII